MTDAIIHDTTPTGSALLAYGESPKNKSRWIIFVAFGIALLLSLALLGIGETLRAEIPLPKSTILIAYIRTSDQLPSFVHEIWKSAREKNSHLPIIVGLAKDQNDEVQPFAITIFRINETRPEKQGFWKLATNNDFGETERVKLSSLPNSWKEFSANAWVRIWQSRIQSNPISENTTEDIDHVGGILSTNQWQTEIDIAPIKDGQSRIQGQNYVNVSEIPKSWPFIETLLREQGFNIKLETEPMAISWSFDNERNLSALLEFEQPMTSATRAVLGGSAGLSDKSVYSLGDGTIFTELRLPVLSISQGTTTEWTLESGDKLIFDENTMIFGNPELISQEREVPTRCNGNIVAVFDNIGIQRLISKLGFGDIPNLDRLYWLEKDGKLVFCW
jgi:hypothetical protein